MTRANGNPLLRWVALIGVTLLSAVVGLVSLILGLQVVLMLLLGMPSSEFLERISIPLSIGIPLALVWFYYRRVLQAEMLITTQLPPRKTSAGLLCAGYMLTCWRCSF